MTLVIFSLFSFPDQWPDQTRLEATLVAEMTGLGGEDWNEELAPSGMTSYGAGPQKQLVLLPHFANELLRSSNFVSKNEEVGIRGMWPNIVLYEGCPLGSPNPKINNYTVTGFRCP